ncbi:MAG: hypothetical protein ACPGJS_04320 [Flammeovirgaceae bacterium]
MRYLIALVFLLLISVSSYAQKIPHLLDNPEKLELIKKSILQMYNWELTQAEASLQKFSSGYEKHPAVPFTKAMIMYWRNAPLDLFGNVFPKHEKLLIEASDLAEQMLDENEEDIEAIFFKMSARSLLMKYYADKGQTMKAVGEAKGVYKLMKKGFDLKEKLNEFYFTTGIYNYYREYYPERYPVYKPFAWVFQSGNKTLGLEQLEYTARNATFTSPEAYTYLSFIYLKYEKKEDKALIFARELAQRFPKNKLFHVKYIETLVLSNRYNQVENLAHKLTLSHRDKFYPTAGNLFKAMAYHNYRNNPEKAFEYYTKAEKNVENLGYRFLLFKTYLYYGLSKYWADKGDSEKAKDYYKKAKEFDENDYLKTVDKPDFK